MSELFVYKDDEEDFGIDQNNNDFVEDITISSIKNKYSSLGLITFYIKNPQELDATKEGLGADVYLYKLFVKASNESKSKSLN